MAASAANWAGMRRAGGRVVVLVLLGVLPNALVRSARAKSAGHRAALLVCRVFVRVQTDVRAVVRKSRRPARALPALARRRRRTTSRAASNSASMSLQSRPSCRPGPGAGRQRRSEPGRRCCGRRAEASEGAHQSIEQQPQAHPVDAGLVRDGGHEGIQPGIQAGMTRLPGRLDSREPGVTGITSGQGVGPDPHALLPGRPGQLIRRPAEGGVEKDLGSRLSWCRRSGRARSSSARAGRRPRPTSPPPARPRPRGRPQRLPPPAPNGALADRGRGAQPRPEHLQCAIVRFHLTVHDIHIIVL